MTDPAPNPNRNATPGLDCTGRYWGIAVQVIERMENCSLIRYRDHEFVVDSQDLQLYRSVSQAA